MSDVKISALPAVTSVATTDVIPVVTGGVTSKIGSQNFVNSGLSGGTANGLLYLNGSKQATSGSALTFDGTNLITTQAVSIGTGTTPGARLDVGGQDGTNIFLRSTGTSSARFRAYVNGAESGVIGFLNGGGQFFEVAGSEQMRLNTTGLGIGTSSPTAKLDVAGTTSTVSIKTTTTTGASYSVHSSTGGNFYLGIDNSAGSAFGGGAYSRNIYSDGSYPILFWTNTAERGRFSADGTFRVKGAGSAGSTDAFQVSGSAPASACSLLSSGAFVVGDTAAVAAGFAGVKFNGASFNGLGLNDSSSTSAVGYIYFQIAGTTIGSITRVAATSAVAYNTTSDQRLKTDLGIATSTDVIDNTKIHDFKWKSDGSKSRGVFAQEAKLVKPEAVTEGKDELNKDGLPVQPWGVDYSKYVPDLIVYCQQLQAQINELKSQLGK